MGTSVGETRTLSHLLAKIMLALLMLPLASVVYAVSAVYLNSQVFGYRREWAPLLLAGLLTWVLVALYWILLWRGTVVWSRRRATLTLAAAAAAVVGGLAVGAIANDVDKGFAMFIGGVSTILIWLALTVFVWREKPEERISRIRGRGIHAVICPRCGYDMTGLEQAACPECGAVYTIDDLMAAQPRMERLEG